MREHDGRIPQAVNCDELKNIQSFLRHNAGKRVSMECKA